jgi:hypothetical protein
VTSAPDGWDDFREDLLTQPMTTPVDEQVLADAVQTLQKLGVGVTTTDDEVHLLRALIARPDVAAAFESALVPLAPQQPRMLLRLRDTVVAPVNSAPIGDQLRQIIRPAHARSNDTP